MKKQIIILGSLLTVTFATNAQNFNASGTSNAVYRDGKTGFGMTTTPTSNKVEVETTSPEDGICITQKSAGGAALYLKNTYNGGHNWGFYSLNNNNTPAGGHFLIQDVTSSVNRFMISGTNGNVGIGTISPSQKLDVNGNMNTNGILYIGSNFTIDGTASTFKNAAWAGTGNRLILSDATGKITPLAQGTSNQVLYGNGTWGNLPATNFVESGSDVRLPTGRLGIGVTSPATALDINGDATVSGNLKSAVLAGTGNRMVYADASGNLKSAGTIGIPCVANASPWFEGGNSSPANNTIGTCTGQDFILKSGGNSSVWVRADGKVGIGTSNPTTKFTLADAGLTELSVFSQSNNSAKLWAMNYQSSYSFGVDYNAIGHIGVNINSTTDINLINFKTDGNNNAQVWIGTEKPDSGNHTDYRLAVDGKLVAKSCYVTLGGWSDYVFADDYKLPSLKEVETYYKTNKHLLDIPSEKEVLKNGIDVGQMNNLLLKKVEELTLYLVEQQKQIDELKKKIK